MSPSIESGNITPSGGLGGGALQIEDTEDVLRSITLRRWLRASAIRIVSSLRNMISEGLLIFAVESAPSLNPVSEVMGVRRVRALVAMLTLASIDEPLK